MFLHNFKYTLKTLFRDKTLIFWTFAFPLLMATFFNLAFANIIEDEKLKVMDIAIINNDEYNNNKIYKETFDYLSDEENEDRLFNIKYINKDEASELLDKDEIEGYLELNDNVPKLTFKENGINQTIFKYVVDQVHDTEKLVENLTISLSMSGQYDMQQIVDEISNKVNEYLKSNSIELDNKANDNMDYMMIEYYTLIAMTCLYAGTLGMVAINKCLPYLKGNGKRISVSPAKKLGIVLGSMLSSYIVQLMTIGLLFAYTIGVLHINYTDQIGYVILLSLIGSIAGVGLGLFVGSYFKASDNSKVGIMIAITMFFCFLSGMMGVGTKYLIDKNLPILNMINPANMITDGFYSLYYYTDYTRFWNNVISLIIFSILMIILSARKIARARYDSI